MSSHPAAVAGVKRQLFEFGAGQEAVAAKVGDQIIDRVATDRHPVRRATLADHRGEIARAVGITADRDGGGQGPDEQREARTGAIAAVEQQQCEAGEGDGGDGA